MRKTHRERDTPQEMSLAQGNAHATPGGNLWKVLGRRLIHHGWVCRSQCGSWRYQRKQLEWGKVRVVRGLVSLYVDVVGVVESFGVVGIYVDSVCKAVVAVVDDEEGLKGPLGFIRNAAASLQFLFIFHTVSLYVRTEVIAWDYVYH